MKERPILFSGPMVRAILEGCKTQTRRVIKPQPGPNFNSFVREQDIKGQWWFSDMSINDESFSVGEFRKYNHYYPKCPCGKPGDLLWVRETWTDLRPYQDRYAYKATDLDIVTKWKPSIHMPREASRILLKVTGVRVERLQDISEEDAISEGVKRYEYTAGDFSRCCPMSEEREKEIEGVAFGTEKLAFGVMHQTAKGAFRELWNRNTINDSRGYGFDANPWVWVVEFNVGEVK